jgi:hypothetical protein
VNLSELKERLHRCGEGVYPSGRKASIGITEFYFCGVGAPIGSPDSDGGDTIPRFWWFADKLNQSLSSTDFERLCVQVELDGFGDSARTLRAHAESLIAQTDSTHTAIETVCDQATIEANQIVSVFAEIPESHRIATLITPFSLQTNLSGWDQLGGNESKRLALSEALDNFSGIFTLRPFDPSNLESVSERYWATLHSAGRNVLKLRYKLRASIERVSVFVEMLNERVIRTTARVPENVTRGVVGNDADAKNNGHRPIVPSESDGEYRPATWFPKGMADRLRQAASKKRKTKRVSTRTVDGVVCYSVADARRWWPDDVPKEA